MAKSRGKYNTNFIKRTWPYSIQEIAELFNIHRGTVRQWLKNGLRMIDNRRPYLIRGHELIRFLDQRQAKKKQKCMPDELYCCKCRKPRQPKDMSVSFRKLNDKVGMISGRCSVCDSRINKKISIAKLSEFNAILKINTPPDTRLSGSGDASVNIDLRR